MSITLASIQEYLASCTPVEPRKAEYTYDIAVPQQPEGKLYPMSDSDNKVIGAINIICGNIEFATNERTEEDVPMSECSEAEEIMVEALSEAIEKTVEATKPEETRLIPMSENALAWAKQEMLFVNSWQSLETNIDRLATAPAGNLAIIHLLEDAKRVEKSMLREMAVLIRTKVRKMLEHYEEIKLEEGVDLKGQRPADVYRAFCKPLEWLVDNGCRMLVNPTLRYLIEDQTMPLNDLDNPDWIDPYTGTVDPEAQEYRFEINKDAPEMSEEELQASEASEAYNDEDGELDFELSPMEKYMLDHEPEEEKDFQYSAEIRKSDAYPVVCEHMGAVRQLLRQTLSSVRMAARLGQFDNQKLMDAWVARRMRSKPVYKDFYTALKKEAENKSERFDNSEAILALQKKIASLEARQDKLGLEPSSEERSKKAKKLSYQIKIAKITLERAEKSGITGAWPADLAYVSAEFQSDDCYPEEMYNSINLYPARAGCETLGQWMQMFGDDVLENSWDEAPIIHSTDQIEIDEYTAQTFSLFVENAADIKSNDVTKSKAYLEAFFNVAINAKSTFKVDETGFRHDLAKEAGWDAWRESKSLKGNQAYKQAIAQGLTAKEAMRAFRSVANQSNETSTKSLDVVVSIAGDKSGLVLQSGRKVSWRIAMLKQRGSEFDWVGDAKDRLKIVLQKMKVGLEFASVL